jgi:hypothetical protein
VTSSSPLRLTEKKGSAWLHHELPVDLRWSFEGVRSEETEEQTLKGGEATLSVLLDSGPQDMGSVIIPIKLQVSQGADLERSAESVACNGEAEGMTVQQLASVLGDGSWSPKSSDGDPVVMEWSWRWRPLWRLFFHLGDAKWGTAVRLLISGQEARLSSGSLLRPPLCESECTESLGNDFECCTWVFVDAFLPSLLRWWQEWGVPAFEEESREERFISSCGSLPDAESLGRGGVPSKVSTTPLIVTGNMLISPLTVGEVSPGSQVAMTCPLELTQGGILGMGIISRGTRMTARSASE